MNVILDISDEALDKAQQQADKNKRSRKRELEITIEEYFQ